MIAWSTSDGIRSVVRDGAAIATLRDAAQRDDAYVDIAGTQWLFFAARGGLWAERTGAEKPAAHATRADRSTWRVQTERLAYEVVRSGRNRYVVRRAGSEIGSGSGGRRASLDLSVSVPVEHEVFLFWLIGAKHRGAKSPGAGGSTMGPSPSAGTAHSGGYVGGM
ncbi:hypothetical protein MU582_04760 [Nocardioidaceae bacterium SCSIO 66511]|nr:hypothetical protein MU582_04760 [Nocardioidaceae bacterium SCSIO 66511]